MNAAIICQQKNKFNWLISIVKIGYWCLCAIVAINDSHVVDFMWFITLLYIYPKWILYNHNHFQRIHLSYKFNCRWMIIVNEIIMFERNTINSNVILPLQMPTTIIFSNRNNFFFLDSFHFLLFLIHSVFFYSLYYTIFDIKIVICLWENF